jgi:Raf kinase inhibitor-like YbhB/YbcL family protein
VGTAPTKMSDKTRCHMNRFPMKHIRLVLSILFLILMVVPAQAQKIDTEVYYRLAVNTIEGSAYLSIHEFQKGKFAPETKGLSTDVDLLWRFVDVGKGSFRLVNASQPSMSLGVAKDPKAKVNLVCAKSMDVSSQYWKVSPLVLGKWNGVRISSLSQPGKGITSAVDLTNWKDGDKGDPPLMVRLSKNQTSESPNSWELSKTNIKIGKVADYVKERKELGKIDPKVYYRLIIEEDWLKKKLALDIHSSSNQGDYAPTTKDLSTDASQLWRFVDEGQGFSRLINASQPDLCLDVITDSITYDRPYDKLALSKTGGGNGQLWKLSPDGLGFSLMNWKKGNGLYVMLDSNSKDFGSLELQAYGSAWMLQKTKISVEGKTDVAAKEKFEISSTAFVNGARIPFEHTGAGANLSPPLAWKGAPAGTKSFMILCTDPDAPSPANPDPNPFVHWFVLNIPADTKYLLAGVPRLEQLSTPYGATQFNNGFGEIGYSGPKPPQGSGKHRYLFTILAMDRVHVIDPKMTIDEFSKLLKSSVLGTAELMGTYEIPASSLQGRLLLRK